MYEVSDAWKEIQTRQLVNEGFIEISFSVSDPDATGDGTVSDSGHVYYSDTSELLISESQAVKKHATLETDAWRADGSFIYAGSTKSACGYEAFVGSALSGSDGAFSTYPTITLSFSKVYTALIPGITIVWSKARDEYATDYTITVYNDSTVVATKDVTGNESVTNAIWVDIQNYNKIVVTVKKWSAAGHHARVEFLLAGILMEYSKKDILSFSQESTCDPISSTLPTGNIMFSLDNVDQSYDPNNPTGMTKYLIERQRISAKYGLKMDGGSVEWIPAGVYYLSEWDAPQNGIDASFTARDMSELLQDTYTKGVYSASGATLYSLAESVLNAANLPKMDNGDNRWVIDNSLKSITTTAPLPMSSCAECLQLIAHAAGCAMWFDRVGKLHIGALSTTASDYMIDDVVQYQRPEISLQKPLKSVSVNTYSYYAGDTTEELYDGSMILSGTQTVTITYNSAATDASADVWGNDAVLNSAVYYANTCELNITVNGQVNITVTGKPLKSSSYAYVLETGATDGETQEIDNQLITSRERAIAIASWASDYLQSRRVLTLNDWRGDTRLDAGDIVSVANDYSTEKARVTTVKYSFTGAFHGSGEARVVSSS